MLYGWIHFSKKLMSTSSYMSMSTLLFWIFTSEWGYHLWALAHRYHVVCIFDNIINVLDLNAEMTEELKKKKQLSFTVQSLHFPLIACNTQS